ncbi:hypothetical protein SAMN05421796_11185 [Chryseobacterium piscicola]|uniref:Uncharacterized protein n=1 Tax=Chryseobacterium piscicola TaxID=551459 RepID=A0A1N7P6V5_9FLAO|nr:hypothetical protein SAMN05421796_11185 [Chryseobacterium piscicola]
MRVYLFCLEFQNQNIYKFYLNILFVKENKRIIKKIKKAVK